MNQTKIQVPRIAVVKAKMARPHRVDAGINSNASKIPNCAEEIVAPVVGETNLLLHSCCIIRPATLMPIPVHIIASSRGKRETKKISHKYRSPDKSSWGDISITPTKSEMTDTTNNIVANISVERYCLILPSPSYKLVMANLWINEKCALIFGVYTTICRTSFWIIPHRLVVCN